jgi:hypothetical protein
MSNGGSYQGIPLYDGPIGMDEKGNMVSGVIMNPENIPHYYKALPAGQGHTSILQVITVGVTSQGSQPPDPPDQFKAKTWHPAASPATGQTSKSSVAVALLQAALTVLQSKG